MVNHTFRAKNLLYLNITPKQQRVLHGYLLKHRKTTFRAVCRAAGVPDVPLAHFSRAHASAAISAFKLMEASDE